MLLPLPAPQVVQPQAVKWSHCGNMAGSRARCVHAHTHVRSCQSSRWMRCRPELARIISGTEIWICRGCRGAGARVTQPVGWKQGEPKGLPPTSIRVAVCSRVGGLHREQSSHNAVTGARTSSKTHTHTHTYSTAPHQQQNAFMETHHTHIHTHTHTHTHTDAHAYTCIHVHTPYPSLLSPPTHPHTRNLPAPLEAHFLCTGR